MSWSRFETNMSKLSDNPEIVSDVDMFASKLASFYIAAIESGSDTLHGISIEKSTHHSMEDKRHTMERLFKLALERGASSRSFDLINELGKGILSYWTGAQMQLLPIPLLPATGSINNIAVMTNTVIYPGSWTSVMTLPPIPNSSMFIKTFILTATIHLQSISGLMTTVSLYPPTSISGPGIINWTGYRVPN